MARKKKKSLDSTFSRKYYDTKASALAYTGNVKKFSTQFPNSKKAKEWLQNQETYSLHKPVRKKGIQGNKTIASCVDAQWQADLADMSNVSEHNDGHCFVLTVIDVLSRYAWAVPVKNKRGKTVVDALEEIFKSSDRSPKYYLHTDQGREFFNPQMKKLSEKWQFHHFHSYSNNKAALVERFNRTIKSYIYRFFTYKQTYRYIDVLPSLVDGYNRRKHSAHGMAPVKVTTENQDKVFSTLYPQLTGKERVKAVKDFKHFQIGNHVRLRKWKHIFEKGYLPNWTTEIFTISGKKFGYPRVAFTIKDWQGEDVEGVFYSEELQKVKQLPEYYLIEKIIGSRPIKPGHKKKKYLVKWKGYPNKFNSWVDEVDVKDLIKLRVPK